MHEAYVSCTDVFFFADGGHAAEGCCDNHEMPRSHDTSRIAWAKLMARAGEEFPLECPASGGNIRLIIFSVLRCAAGSNSMPVGSPLSQDDNLSAAWTNPLVGQLQQETCTYGVASLPNLFATTLAANLKCVLALANDSGTPTEWRLDHGRQGGLRGRWRRSAPYSAYYLAFLRNSLS